MKVVKIVASFLAWWNPWNCNTFITVIVGNLKNMFSRSVTLLLLLAFCDLSNISPSCNEATILSFSSFLFFLTSFVLIFFFLPSLFWGFWLVDRRANLSLQSYGFFITLVVTRIDTYLQWAFSLRTILVQVMITINVSLSFGFISCINKFISGHLLLAHFVNP